MILLKGFYDYFSNQYTLFTSCKLLTLLSCFLTFHIGQASEIPSWDKLAEHQEALIGFGMLNLAFIFIGVHILFLHSEMSIILGLCMGIRVAICPLNLKLSVIIIWVLGFSLFVNILSI